jgi:hypothetical protein
MILEIISPKNVAEIGDFDCYVDSNYCQIGGERIITLVFQEKRLFFPKFGAIHPK